MNQEECKTEHPYQPDCETRNIVSSSNGVSCAEKDGTYGERDICKTKKLT